MIAITGGVLVACIVDGMLLALNFILESDTK